VIKLTFQEYKTLPKPVRQALRRKAFGHPRPLPPQLEGQFDLQHLQEVLIAENARTGDFGTKWTDDVEDEVEA